MMVWIMCGAKGIRPDAIRQQAWSWGDARYIGRHGPRAMPKVAMAGTRRLCSRAELVDGGARPKVGSRCEAKGNRAKQGFV